jgi:hypothetical protein
MYVPLNKSLHFSHGEELKTLMAFFLHLLMICKQHPAWVKNPATACGLQTP